MAKTFSYRRQDVIQAFPVKDFNERWPTLFEPTQGSEELQMLLESTFIQKLDEYTPKLLDLFKSKGDAIKADMQKILEVLYRCDTIQERRDSVIHGLIIYLGEIFDADNTMIQENIIQQVMKVFTVKDLHQNIEHGICIEGAEVLAGIPSVTWSCTLLMGLIYGLNLRYPKN